MTALQQLLTEYRKASQSEREKGTYFEELIITYLRNEATYADLYSDVWMYADWAKEQGVDGRDVADLHINYETVDSYPVTRDIGKLKKFKQDQYRVTRMKFKKKSDMSTVLYNEFTTIKDIPLEAYENVVNGKPALEWAMERQAVTTDKKSGIVNDANLWATETMNNPKYPLELFLRVITVSLETMKIVKALPALDID